MSSRCSNRTESAKNGNRRVLGVVSEGEGTDVEGEIVGKAEGAGEAETLVLCAGGAVADEDGAANDGGAASAAASAREDLGRLHAVDARRLG